MTKFSQVLMVLLTLSVLAGCGKYHRIGVQVGSLDFSDADVDEYQPTSAIGVTYTKRGKITTEASFLTSSVESSDGNVTGSLNMVNFNYLFSNWSSRGYAPSIYGFSGGMLALSDGEMATGINLGGGLASLKARFDLRFTFSLLFGSENIQSFNMFSAGYRF